MRPGHAQGRGGKRRGGEEDEAGKESEEEVEERRRVIRGQRTRRLDREKKKLGSTFVSVSDHAGCACAE